MLLALSASAAIGAKEAGVVEGVTVVPSAEGVTVSAEGVTDTPEGVWTGATARWWRSGAISGGTTTAAAAIPAITTASPAHGRDRRAGTRWPGRVSGAMPLTTGAPRAADHQGPARQYASEGGT